MVRLIRMLSVVMIVVMAVTAAAQDAPAPQAVQVEASDGLALVGDYFVSPSDAEARPAVLLMHMYGSERGSWSPVIPALLEAGYDVLAVDLRGHGDTGGAEDWELAVGDVQVWLDWLRAQPGVRAEAVSTMGASVGSNLALVGCANDAQCVTAIALSPGLDFYGVKPETSVSERLRDRSALLLATQADTESAEAVRQMVMTAQGEIGARIWTGATHGTTMFTSPRMRNRLIPIIVGWLDEHQPR
ncbi:MAG: alpha/beta fold hydrolase [Anaerolineae bacterium]|nr:alpha/beta fold hydrolase [Anaerolineae bacterium]